MISIYESYARYCSSNGVVAPNIVDDIDHLVSAFMLLRDKKVWHAGIDEIVSYYKNYLDIIVSRINDEEFSLLSKSSRKYRYDDYITLKLGGLDSSRDYDIHFPNGGLVRVDNRLERLRTVTLPLQEGTYRIVNVTHP